MDAVLNPIDEDVIRGKKKLNLPFFTKGDLSKSSTNLTAMRQFHNTIKSAMYKEYAANKKLLEIGAGRFGDLRKWIKYNVKEVTAIDADASALEEGLQRVEEMKLSGNKVPKITTKVIDATQSKWEISGDKSYDCIAIMFAVHFFLGSDVILKRFIKNCLKYIKRDGIIMMTTMDGKLVYDMLHEAGIKKGETLDLKNKKGETIFSFRQECFCENFSDWGQEVSVYVESIGNYNKEYLVNFDYLIKEFEAAGFEVVSKTGFEEFYKQRKQKNKNLSEVEKRFSFFDTSLILRRLSKSKTTSKKEHK
jgi:mRNA (guanine-N7-)-methyltransferase